MKSVLICIQPQWCELIANGKKTIEVRKTRPKLDAPFKVYIYETKGKKQYFSQPLPIPYNEGQGKVVGEFVCDRISPIAMPGYELVDVVDCETSCLSPKEMLDYAGGKPLDGWHISNLVIYDKPKELSEFHITGCQGCKYKDTYHCKFHCRGKRRIKRPPQSWCYVEEGSAE